MKLTQENVEKLDVGQNDWALLCKGLLLDAIEAGDKLEAENERLKAENVKHREDKMTMTLKYNEVLNELNDENERLKRELKQSATNCNKL